MRIFIFWMFCLTICLGAESAEKRSLLDCKLRLQNVAKTIAWFESLHDRELRSLDDLKQPEMLRKREFWFFPPNSLRSYEYPRCPVSGREYEFDMNGEEWTLTCPGDSHGGGRDRPSFEGFSVI